eukprot:jgi/Mesen1/6559/ME000334S05897
MLTLDSSDVGDWREALESYPSQVAALQNEKLEALDIWYRETFPAEIAATAENPHMTKKQLSKLMEWKLSRGTWRPRLLAFVASLSEEEVVEQSTKAFAALPDVKAAVNHLAVLKGVGPATASAILAAYAPQHAPFMSDEALQVAMGEAKYTLPFYLQFAAKLTAKAQELQALEEKAGAGTGSTQPPFTPSDVERAIWASYTNRAPKNSKRKAAPAAADFAAPAAPATPAAAAGGGGPPKGADSAPPAKKATGGRQPKKKKKDDAAPEAEEPPSSGPGKKAAAKKSAKK